MKNSAGDPPGDGQRHQDPDSGMKVEPEGSCGPGNGAISQSYSTDHNYENGDQPVQEDCRTSMAGDNSRTFRISVSHTRQPQYKWLENAPHRE